MQTDPLETTAATARATTATEPTQQLGRDEFLRMLIAQLENQDPLEPQDPTQFTAQLAQFSTLEQLISIRSAIESLDAASDTPGLMELSALIGREVMVEAQQIQLREGSATSEFELSLAGATDDVRVSLVDGRGREVRQIALGPLAAGRHRIVWDGSSDAGRRVPEGVYGIQVEASQGRTSVPVETRVQGTVSAASLGQQGEPVIWLGDVVVPAARLLEVRQAEAGS